MFIYFGTGLPNAGAGVGDALLLEASKQTAVSEKYAFWLSSKPLGFGKGPSGSVRCHWAHHGAARGDEPGWDESSVFCRSPQGPALGWENSDLALRLWGL